ncbi:MAG TPA: efflux RND transporter periplasmic adaptor subunit [Gemmataceae bacterium]|nr:efflux RND transporter periplasmic adaptor subunit [Gemmataceae bacterium]
MTAKPTDNGSATALERAETARPPVAEPATQRSRKGKLILLLAVVAAFAAGWVAACWSMTRTEKEAFPLEKIAPRHGADAVMVTVEPVKQQTIQRAIEALGTLHAFEDVTISTKVEGRVRHIHHDVADFLKPGELLLEIDSTDYELAVRQAELTIDVELAKLGLQKLPEGDVELLKLPNVMQAQARMDNAKSKFERMKNLAAAKASSVEDFENASSDSRVAQAEYANQILLAKAGLATIKMKQATLAISKQQLEDCKVFAPTPKLSVPGVESVTYAVTQRAVAEGTFVRVGTELCKLVINSTLKLRVMVPERFSSEVKAGQKVEVFTAALPSPCNGVVARISPAVDPTTRTFIVEILVPNPDGELKSGSFAKASILTRTDSKALTVPLTSLVQFAGITKLFLVENGKAKEVQVSTGMQTTAWVEITAPALPAGANVITSGHTLLSNDTPVAVRLADAPTAQKN